VLQSLRLPLGAVPKVGALYGTLTTAFGDGFSFISLLDRQ